MIDVPPDRPPLQSSMGSREFLRWYWLKAELETFARALGIRTSGSKQAITTRIVAALDGRPAPREAPSRRASGVQLTGLLTESTIIPPGQRCSQALRAWFTDRIGAQFRFDEPMRTFITSAEGTATLGDAVATWHATRDRLPDEIGEQFELNRFTRRWHQQHPEGSRAQLQRAWSDYRNTPIDERR